MKRAASTKTTKPAETEESQTARHVAEHPSRNVKELHKMAEALEDIEQDFEGYLCPTLIEHTEARWAIEATRDSILFMG